MSLWLTGLGFTALAVAGAWVRVTGANPARALARAASSAVARLRAVLRRRRARYRHRGEPAGLGTETRAAIRDWLRG